MAALDTFEWFIRHFYPDPDPATAELLRREREYLMEIRNENERLRYIDELMRRVRESMRTTA